MSSHHLHKELVDERKDASGAINFLGALKVTQVNTFLRNDLQAAGNAGWDRYNSHSFRRGGTQHWHHRFGWNIPDLCAWCGWSLSDAMTVVRYLYSENDLQRPIDSFSHPDHNYTQQSKGSWSSNMVKTQ